MRRYGASNINAMFLDRVVIKGRKALGMTIEEEWTEALETWCHGFLQAQLADPAFLAAQQLRKMKSVSAGKETPASPKSKKGAGNKKNQESSKAAKLVEEKVDAVRRRTPRPPTVDDVLEAKRENSLRKLFVKEESTSSLLSMPKKPERKESNPKRRANEVLSAQKQARNKNLSPSEFLVRRNSASLLMSDPQDDAPLTAESPNRKKPFPKEPHPKAIQAISNENRVVGSMESLTGRIHVTKPNESKEMQSTVVRVPCKPSGKEPEMVDEPLRKGSNRKQNTDSSMGLTKPQRKNSPMKAVLRNKKKSLKSGKKQKTTESNSKPKQTSKTSKAKNTRRKKKSSPASCIFGMNNISSDSETEASPYLTETMAVVNQALKEKKQTKFGWYRGAPPTKITPLSPLHPSLMATEGSFTLQNALCASYPVAMDAAVDDNGSYASSITSGSCIPHKDDLFDKTTMDRWNAHSAKDVVAEPKRKVSSVRPFRCRTIPLYLQERLDYTPKRPNRKSEASMATTIDTDCSEKIPTEVRVYKVAEF